MKQLWFQATVFRLRHTSVGSTCLLTEPQSNLAPHSDVHCIRGEIESVEWKLCFHERHRRRASIHHSHHHPPRRRRRRHHHHHQHHLLRVLRYAGTFISDADVKNLSSTFPNCCCDSTSVVIS